MLERLKELLEIRETLKKESFESRLSLAQTLIPMIQKKGEYKDKYNSDKNYKFVKVEDVIKEVNKACGILGIYCYAEIVDDGLDETKTFKETKMAVHVVDGFNKKEDGSPIEIVTICKGVARHQFKNTLNEKSVQIAATYGRKYGLIHAFNIATEDEFDGDGNYPEDKKKGQQEQQKPQNYKPTETQQPIQLNNLQKMNKLLAEGLNKDYVKQVMKKIFNETYAWNEMTQQQQSQLVTELEARKSKNYPEVVLSLSQEECAEVITSINLPEQLKYDTAGVLFGNERYSKLTDQQLHWLYNVLGQLKKMGFKTLEDNTAKLMLKNWTDMWNNELKGKKKLNYIKKS